MFNDISKTILDVAAIAFAAVGVPGLYALMGYAKTRTKDRRLQLALTWGQQAVLVAESFMGDGSAQKTTAMNDLQKRLVANGLSKYFSAQQVDAIIQQGYATVKQSGLLKQVAPTISASSDPQPNVEKPVMDKVTTPAVKAVVPDMRKPQGGTNA